MEKINKMAYYALKGMLTEDAIIYRQPITDDGKISLYCRISPSTTRIN